MTKSYTIKSIIQYNETEDPFRLRKSWCGIQQNVSVILEWIEEEALSIVKSEINGDNDEWRLKLKGSRKAHQAFSEKLGFNPKFIKSSELDISGLKSDLILDICKVVGATTYIAGPSGRDYLDMKSFEEEGIKVV